MPYGETGYIEQGYANVAALPYEMQLVDVQTRRMQLEQNQIETRTLRRAEMDDLQNRQEADLFTGWLQNHPDATPEQQSEFVRANPGLRDNDTVAKFLDYSSKDDERLTNFGSNKVTRARNENEMKNISYRESVRDDVERTNDINVEANLALAKKALENVEKANIEDIRQNTKAVSSALFSITSRMEGGKEAVEDVIGLFTGLSESDNELDHQAAVSIQQITESMGAIVNLGTATKALIGRHQSDIDNYNRVLQKIDPFADVMAGINNPDTKDETLTKIGQMLKSVNATEEELNAFREFSESVTTASKMEADGSTLKDDFFAAVKEIEALRMQPQTEETRKIMSKKLAFLNAKGSLQASYVDAGLKQQTLIWDEHKRSNEEQKQVAELRKTIEGLDQAKQREARYQLAEIRNQQLSAAKTDLDYKKLLRSVFADQTEEMWGISEENSVQENIEILRGKKGVGVGGPNDLDD